MTELDMIDDKENNDNFHQLITVNNQDIFDVEGKIELRFSINYIKCISANLAS